MRVISSTSGVLTELIPATITSETRYDSGTAKKNRQLERVARKVNASYGRFGWSCVTIKQTQSFLPCETKLLSRECSNPLDPPGNVAFGNPYTMNTGDPR